MARSGFTLIELMVVVIVISLLAAIAIPNYMSMQMHAKEGSTKSNCHTVQIAAEDFAVQNDGVYAAGTGDALPNGRTIQDLLPAGRLLNNPFTGAASEPQWGLAAALPGQIGYVAIQDGSGTNVGYTITGFGKYDLVITLSSGF